MISCFKSISVKCLSCQIYNEIVDNQDLYRNKDDFCQFFKTKKNLFFNSKYFILYKYIRKMYILTDI